MREIEIMQLISAFLALTLAGQALAGCGTDTFNGKSRGYIRAGNCDLKGRGVWYCGDSGTTVGKIYQKLPPLPPLPLFLPITSHPLAFLASACGRFSHR